MAGFGQTVKKQEEKKEVVKAPTQQAPTLGGSPLSLRSRTMQQPVNLTRCLQVLLDLMEHVTGIVKGAFDEYVKDNPDELHAIDFDMGVSMLNSAVNPNENTSRGAMATGVADRTAYDYPGTHQRVMDIMKFIPAG